MNVEDAANHEDSDCGDWVDSSRKAVRLDSVTICNLHQINKVARDAVGTRLLPWIVAMHCFSMLIQTGNYFMRLVLATGIWVRQSLVIVFGYPGNAVA